MGNPITNSAIEMHPLLEMNENPSYPTVKVDIFPGPTNSQVARTISCSKCFFANRERIALATKVTTVVAFSASLLSAFAIIAPNEKTGQIAEICAISFFILTSISGFTYLVSRDQSIIER